MERKISDALAVLGSQAAGLNWSEVEPEAQDRTLLVLFDTLGVMLAGSRTQEVRALAEQYREPGDAPVVGMGRATSAEGSCWVNGMSVCTLELDEGSKHARGHPAAHVVPVALAVANRHSGSEWLAGVLAGYEVAARFGRATRLTGGVHPHGTWGVVGAAATAAKLNGLNDAGIAAAMDAAAGLSLAPHFESAFRGDHVRNLWVGAAGAGGLSAARLAAAGLTGSGTTARFTFGEILGEFDPSPLAVPFRERLEILGGYFKRHAACAYTHAAADCVLGIRADADLDPAEVESIAVETYAIAATLDRTEWPTRLAAMFSIPYVVAVTLVHGRFGREATESIRREDATISALARRVDVRSSDEFDRRLPDRRGARVTVRMEDGSSYVREVEQTIGDADHQPLGWNEVRSKLAALIGDDRTETLESAVRALPEAPVSVLIDEVQRS